LPKKSVVLKSTQIILNVLQVIILFMIVGGLLTNIYYPDIVQMNRTLNLLAILIFGGLGFYILVMLQQVVRTVALKDPFCRANVKRFRAIGYAVFVVGALITVINYPYRGDAGFQLIGTQSGGVGPEILIFILLGCLAMLLSEIFSEALVIKEENEKVGQK